MRDCEWAQYLGLRERVKELGGVAPFPPDAPRGWQWKAIVTTCEQGATVTLGWRLQPKIEDDDTRETYGARAKTHLDIGHLLVWKPGLVRPEDAIEEPTLWERLRRLLAWHRR